MKRRWAILTVDLDNLWVYQQVYGGSDWWRLDSFLELVVPRLVQLIDRAEVPATVFTVGMDARRAENRRQFRSLLSAGCELANHSMMHSFGIARLRRAELVAELSEAHDAVAGMSGIAPVGFRAPGYSWGEELGEALADLGYLYDSSPLHCRGKSLMRAVVRSHSKGQSPDARGNLFGNDIDATKAARPARLVLPSGRTIAQVPVSVVSFPLR